MSGDLTPCWQLRPSSRQEYVSVENGISVSLQHPPRHTALGRTTKTVHIPPNSEQTISLAFPKVQKRLIGLVYWGLTPQQQPGSYQGGEMMMKSVFWWRKPEYPEETTDLRQVTDEIKRG